MDKTAGHRELRIGIFDSGVGGISIYLAIREKLPGAAFYYCSDSANYPYGVKSEEEVVECASRACTDFIEKDQLTVLVVACNTASTVALTQLRKLTNIPVVGVVPAIKPAVAISKSNVIGLLATPGTIKRKYTDDLIQEFASNAKVLRLGTRKLVDLAEDKISGNPVSLSSLREILEPIWNAIESDGLDVIVLGCTHFPLLIEEFKKLAINEEKKVSWVDSGEAIANRVVEIVMAEDLENTDSQNGPGTLRFTKMTEKVLSQIDCIQSMGLILDNG